MRALILLVFVMSIGTLIAGSVEWTRSSNRDALFSGIGGVALTGGMLLRDVDPAWWVAGAAAAMVIFTAKLWRQFSSYRSRRDPVATPLTQNG